MIKTRILPLSFLMTINHRTDEAVSSSNAYNSYFGGVRFCYRAGYWLYLRPSRGMPR